jgi:hypothetical protein
MGLVMRSMLFFVGNACLLLASGLAGAAFLNQGGDLPPGDAFRTWASAVGIGILGVGLLVFSNRRVP